MNPDTNRFTDRLDRNVLSSVTEGAEKAYHSIEARARDATRASSKIIQKYPFYAVLGAAAVGFLMSSLIRRAY